MAPANPLDAWTAEKIGCTGPSLARADLADYQRRQLRETVLWAKRHSPFYRRHLAAFDDATLNALDDPRSLPLTTADDLRRNDPPLLCVSQSRISRVVTLETSGTSGPPKRLFFTPEEQESTLDFFDYGMRLPARQNDRVLIFFPGERQGSVGDLLARALERLGATPVPFGWPGDLKAAAEVLRREQPDVVAGLPVPMLAVARTDATLNRHRKPIRVRSVLLSADHATGSLRRSLAELWGCEVFEHYGMTEMGLGGGVDCAAHTGYHMRENELLVEVVDPASGEPVAVGEVGEVVFTTLNRRGMPLIRYRTGDRSRLLPGPCACGSALARLDRITGRIGAAIALGDASELTIAMLDEAVFSFADVIDFEAAFEPGAPPALDLTLRVTDDGAGQSARDAVFAALSNHPRIAAAVSAVGLRLLVTVSPSCGHLEFSGKRRIRLPEGAR
jgi:phenylacetate-coenzyme A ligase PaaK-like adenylate-forming protein